MSIINNKDDKDNLKTQTPFDKLNKRVNLDYQHLQLIKYFIKNKIYSYKIIEADNDYYSLTLEQRRKVLRSHSVDVLCKTIILENTNYDPKYESKYYKQYYMTIVQYTSEFHADKIAKIMKQIQNEKCEVKLSNKYFHFRLAEKNLAFDMTGYQFNCITPYLSKTEMPILFPTSVIEIYPQYFYVGGGEIELKIGISVNDFMRLFGDNCFVIDL